jgi:drug/metabolite transporter (DMT)-like permease
MTGLAEAWSGLRDGAAARGERGGLVLMVFSAAAFAAMAAFAKFFLPDTPTQAVVLSRGIMMTAVFLGVALWRGLPVRGKSPGKLVLRGALGYAALSCYFFSVQHLPLGDAVLLQYSHPVFVGLLAPWLLGERTRRGHWPLVALALGGVALIVGPQGELRGAAAIGLLGSMLSGLAYITVRELSRTEHPLTILLWFPLVSIPFSLAASLRAGEAAIPSTASEVAGHLLVFLSALVGQIALTAGLARVDAARATAISLTGPVFGFLFGLVLFGTPPSAASVAGTAIVVGSLAFMARRKSAGA